MKISNNKHLNILDVPNEILLMIFSNLNVVDVLYSLVNVTQRFDQLILEPFYTHSLDMTSMTMKSYFDRIYSIDSQLLDRICQNILPRIHRQVHELIVEQHSMAQDKTTPPPLPENLSTIFVLILSLCKGLIELNFCQFYHRSTACTFELSSTNWKSSTLTVLKITLKSFDDCLYLLDGRLNCLSTLITYVKEIANALGTIAVIGRVQVQQV
ncbi:unnamed protein product [Rotaria magnacalcarata]|uniref:F-box domain-containing protein n=1 Tax=Rotaria magnacalcarata TaxID=392030 RepID=A0A820PAY0_9BILA|nr:unnamed protein product [Rotaria magnacalcarata]